jgi:hypothetical protein
VNISRDEAGLALQEIGRTTARVCELRSYRYAAPHLIIWGGVWIAANLATAWRTSVADQVWTVLALLGAAASTAVGILGHRSAAPDAAETLRRRQRGQRFLLSACAFVVFQALITLLIKGWPSGVHVNASTSLLVALAYVLLGLWTGSRIAWLGVLLAATTMTGFYLMPQHYSLWMGLIGGGMLLGTGLWLRRV